MWWGTALVLPCVALPQSIKQSQSPRRAPDMVVYAVRRQSKWLHMGLAAAKSQMSPHPIHTPRCVTVLLEGRRHRRDIFSLPSSVGQRGVCPSAGASGSPDVTAGRHSDCLRGWQCERGQKRRKKEETGRRHNLRIQYIQLTSCLSQISRHSMKKKVRVEFMASTIGRDLAISNLMDRGGSEKAKAEPMEGALASFPPSPHASKKGGADGSFLFIPCLARVSPVSRSHDLQRQRPSPPRPPRLCHVSKVCWFGWLQQEISSCLGMVTWRPAGATVTLCIAILTHHRTAWYRSIASGASAPTLRQYCTVLSVVVLLRVVLKSRPPSRASLGERPDPPIYCGRTNRLLRLWLAGSRNNRTVTLPCNSRDHNHTGHHFAALTLDSAACRPQINAVKRAGAARIPQTHHEQFPIRGTLHQPSSSRAAGLGSFAPFVFQPPFQPATGWCACDKVKPQTPRLAASTVTSFSQFRVPPLSHSVHLQLHRSPCLTTSSGHDNSS
jgi:hypothetical protein